MDQNKWHQCWQVHLRQYLAAPPRTGIFIHTYFPFIKSSLEVACGSSRDSIYLAKKGVNATASDYEKRIVDFLRESFSQNHLTYVEADAFCLPFRNNTFDLVFHNGLFIYFNNNIQIYSMLREQCRVTKKYVLFFVHNRLNLSLVKRFAELSAHDPMYDIRFFEPDEIVKIVESASIDYPYSVRVFKFGGQVDILFNKRLKGAIPNILYPWREIIIPKIYQIQNWKTTERIGCLIEMKK